MCLCVYVCMFIYKGIYSKELADMIMEAENPMICSEEAAKGQALGEPMV